jgi:hypothetical protein
MLKLGLGMFVCKSADNHSDPFGKPLRIPVFLQVLYAQVKLTEVIDGHIDRILTLPRISFCIGIDIINTLAFGTTLRRAWQFCVSGRR